MAFALATQRPAEMRGARRSIAPPPALTDAIAYAVGRTYGPGYSFQVRSGVVAEKKGTSGASSSGRHILDGPGAADVRIFDPQGKQITGAALTPLAQNWVANFGSIGVNRYGGANRGQQWTHMDLVDGAHLAKGQSRYWSYGGFAPGSAEKIGAWVGKKGQWVDGQPPDDIATALYDATAATRKATVRNAPPRSGVLVSLFGRGDLGTVDQQPQTAQSAIASLIDPGGGTAIPEMPSPLLGFAPGMIETASLGVQPPSSMPVPSFDMANPAIQPPPQWAQASGFPIDEALTGASARDVLMGGPRPNPLRAPVASAPIPPDMGSMRSATDVLDAGPRLNPRRAIASAPVGPTTAQGVLDMGPRIRPPLEVAMPTPPMRPSNFVWNGGGAPDASSTPDPRMNPRRDPFGFPIDVTRPALANGDGSFSTEETTTFDAAEVGMPSEIVTVPTIINGQRVSEDEAKAAFAAGQNPPVQRGFASFDDAETAAQARTDAIPGARATADAPFVSSFPARPEGPAGGMPAAPWQPTVAGRMEVPGALPVAAPEPERRFLDDELYSPGNQLGRNRFDNYQHRLKTRQEIADFGGAMESRGLARDLRDTRRMMERELTALPGTGVGADPSAYPPEAFTGMPSLTDRISDAAGPRSSAWQVAGLPDLNGASFPGPPPAVGTVEPGSTGGEFFTPAPPMPRAPPDLMSQRFDDAFAPAAPGMIADLPGSTANRQPQPAMTAQDGINSVFGAPPAQATPPNLAIPFAEVPGFGVPPASAATIASPLPSPAMPAPQPISMEAFNDRFGGGSVVRPPTPVPGQPGVVSGEMPTPEGAMDIRPPVQGGPAFSPMPAALAEPPRQTNVGQQKKDAIGRVLGGILGGAVLGPIGGLAGGLLGGALRGGGGGFGFGFGGQPSFAWSSGGSAPYGNNGGTTTYQKGTSNAAGGGNALSWQGSGGQQVTVVQDPLSGVYYGPTYS